MLMGNLQSRNPQMASQISNAMQSGANPQDFMKQMMGNVNPQQMQQIMTQAKSIGVPDNVLSQVQNMNNK